MTRLPAAILAISLAGGAWAQTTASPPSAAPSGPAAPASPTPVLPAPTPPAPGPNWLPRDVAELSVLDKVSPRRAVLHVKVGETGRFGALRILVKSCYVRPPDQPEDATAYLVITDRPDTPPRFQGWMVASMPAASMLEHPIYDVRVTGCR